ncbi:MAG: tetratricopeptide repeat protein [Dethiobacteria bacterium]
MKIGKNSFIILLIITLLGTGGYYAFRDRVQLGLNNRIAYSLELNREAAEPFSESKYAEARELLLESLSLNKLNPHTFACLAFVEQNLGNSQQAYEHFVSTLNMEATSVEIISNLAELLIESGHYAEAERYLKYGLQDYAESEILLELLDNVKSLKKGNN